MVKPYINFTVLCVRKTESCPSSPVRLQSSGYKASLRSVSFQRGETPTPAHTRQSNQSRPHDHCCRNKMSFSKHAIVAYLTHSYITQELLEIQPNMKHVEVRPRVFFCTSLGWNRSLASHSGWLIPVELALCIYFIGRRWTPEPLWIYLEEIQIAHVGYRTSILRASLT